MFGLVSLDVSGVCGGFNNCFTGVKIQDWRNLNLQSWHVADSGLDQGQLTPCFIPYLFFHSVVVPRSRHSGVQK